MMKDHTTDMMTANALQALQRLEAASEEAFRLSSLRNYLQVSYSDPPPKAVAGNVEKQGARSHCH